MEIYFVSKCNVEFQGRQVKILQGLEVVFYIIRFRIYIFNKIIRFVYLEYGVYLFVKYRYSWLYTCIDFENY